VLTSAQRWAHDEGIKTRSEALVRLIERGLAAESAAAAKQRRAGKKGGPS
jgi:hypothetical protein